MAFFDRLAERVRTTGSVLAVGLNPERERLPDDCLTYEYPRRAFTRSVVDATHEHVAAYLLNPAAYADAEGWTALAETVAYARGRGAPIVLDGKYVGVPDGRGDLLGRVDAVTVSPWNGPDALAAACDRGLGAFVVCRTPNAGAADLQDRELSAGDTLAERVAELTAERAAEREAAVGLLVGGSGDDLGAIRERAPGLPFLVAGGAKNDPAVAEHALPEESGPAAGLVAVSREVLYAGETAGRERGRDAYASAAGRAAKRLAGQLNP